VPALRKPTVAAWAVNQLVRTQSGATAALGEQARAQGKDGYLGRELHHADLSDAAVDTLSALGR
jgi:hypothetical protein